jgi:CBS domain-containing protein
MDHWHSVSLERFLKPLFEHSEQLGGLKAPLIEPDSSVKQVIELFLKSRSEALYLNKENLIIVEGEFFKQICHFQNEGVDLQTLTALHFAKKNPESLNEQATILDGLRHLYQSTNPFFIQIREEQVYLFSARDILQFFIHEFSKELEDFQLSSGKMRAQLGVQAEDYFLDTSKNDHQVGGDLFLIPLSRLLVGSFIRVDEDCTILKTMQQMINADFPSALIMQYETTLSGILTNRDLFRSFLHADIKGWEDFNLWSELKVSQIMTGNPDTLGIRHTLAHGLCLIHDGGYRQLIVVDEEKIPLGVISLSHILRFIARFLPDAKVPDQV